MESIGGFKLRTNGGFFCAGRVQYIDANGNPQLSERWPFIPLGQSEMIWPGEKRVPDGVVMRLYVDIEGRDARAGAPYFTYDGRLRTYAEYDVTGTVRDSQIHFDGLKT